MQDEGDDHQLAVADDVGKETEEEDGGAEADEPHPGDLAEVELGEAEIRAPGAEDVAAHGETHARGDQGQEAGPEQDLLASPWARLRLVMIRPSRDNSATGYPGELTVLG